MKTSELIERLQKMIDETGEDPIIVLQDGQDVFPINRVTLFPSAHDIPYAYYTRIYGNPPVIRLSRLWESE